MNRIVVSGSGGKRLHGIIHGIARKFLILLKEDFSILEITCLGSKEMKTLKRRAFRSHPSRVRRRIQRPVDVLAFSEPRDFSLLVPHRKILGEIYLNSDLIFKDEETRTRLILHGILHCKGYLHNRAKDASRMEKIERRLLKEIRE